VSLFSLSTALTGSSGDLKDGFSSDIWGEGVTRLVLECCDSDRRATEGMTADGRNECSPNSSAEVSYGHQQSIGKPPVPLGLCYLDPGGGYGTRQLRFARWVLVVHACYVCLDKEK
jgi:hypothetical protein